MAAGDDANDLEEEGATISNAGGGGSMRIVATRCQCLDARDGLLG
jgi:hypothetical protein